MARRDFVVAKRVRAILALFDNAGFARTLDRRPIGDSLRQRIERFAPMVLPHIQDRVAQLDLVIRIVSLSSSGRRYTNLRHVQTWHISRSAGITQPFWRERTETQPRLYATGTKTVIAASGPLSARL